MLIWKICAKLPFLGIFSQSVEILLLGNCCQFGSNKLKKILTGLEVSYVDNIELILGWGKQRGNKCVPRIVLNAVLEDSGGPSPVWRAE